MRLANLPIGAVRTGGLGPDAGAPSAVDCSLERQIFLQDTCSESNKRSHAHGTQQMAFVLGKQPFCTSCMSHYAWDLRL